MKNNKKWLPMPRFLLRQDALNQISKKLEINGKNSLEIGFGAGEILKFMAKKGANVTGFDFSQQAVELARQRISSSKFVNKILITDDEKSIKIGFYDFVIAFEVLEHIEDDSQAFEKWLSYLKPGGSLIISVPAHMSKWCKNDIWAGHIKRYEQHELKKLGKRKNITIKQLWNYGYPLILLLDKLLNKTRKDVKFNEQNINQKITQTKKSGIDRDVNLMYRLLSNSWVLYPFYLLQRLFFKKDYGSGYIMHVINNEK